VSEIRFIAGSGRSGTTWVLDALATANRLRPVFEPLNPYVTHTGKVYAHRTLMPDESHPDLTEFLEAVFAGRQARLWTQYRRQRQWLVPSARHFSSVAELARLGRRQWRFLREGPGLAAMAARKHPLVKCIRANLMLGWLSRQFCCRMILIVRHPGAVIESELRGGWQAENVLERFRNDPQLGVATGNRYDALLHRRLSTAEALTVRWLVENQTAMEDAPRNGVAVVHYEHLASRSRSVWEHACSALNLGNLPSSTILARPSQQSSPQGSAVRSDAIAKPKWQHALSSEQTDQIQGMLECADFKTYQIHDPEPCLRTGAVALAAGTSAQ
jgi:hypothetical protein